MEKAKRFVKENGRTTLMFLLKNTLLLLVIFLLITFKMGTVFITSQALLISLIILSYLYFILRVNEKDKTTKFRLIRRFSGNMLIGGILILLLETLLRNISGIDTTVIPQILRIIEILKPYCITLTILAGISFSQLLMQKEVGFSSKKEKAIKMILILLFFLLITSRIVWPIIYQGGFIDEYYHILSGLQFFKTGQFAQLYHNKIYTRGSYVSFLVALLMNLFGENIFVGKMLPATLGIGGGIILYNIGKKIFKNKWYLGFLLLLYLILPWFLFNHFYIRMYIFYEFFTLLLTLFAFLIIENTSKIKSFLIYLSAFLLLLLSIYLFSKDFGQYLLLIYGGILLSYIFFFEIQKLELKNKLLNFITRNHLFKILFFLLISLALFLYLDGWNLIQTYRLTRLTFTSASTHKYDNFFFSLNIFFTIFFLISPTYFFSKETPLYVKILMVPSFFLFLLHVFAPIDLQITRGIIYFLPLFYILSLFTLSETLSRLRGKGPKIFILVALLIGIYTMYPEDFFTAGPNLPTDVEYREFKIAMDISPYLTTENPVIMTHYPHLFKFYNKNTDYEIYYLRDNFNSFAFDPSLIYLGKDDKYYFAASHDEIITDAEMFKDIIDRSEEVILILDDSATYAWVTKESQYIIHRDFDAVNILGKLEVYVKKKGDI